MGASKGQLISKANCQAVNSSKKRTNEFVFTSMRFVFVRFLEEIEDSKKAFRNYLTFKWKAGVLCILCTQKVVWSLCTITVYQSSRDPREG